MLNEVIIKENGQIAFDLGSEKLYESARQTNSPRAKAKKNDGAFLVETGPTISLGDAIKLLQKNRALSSGSQISDQITCFENKLFEPQQCDGLCSFCSLSADILNQRKWIKKTQFKEKCKFQNLLSLLLKKYCQSKKNV